MSVSPCTGHTFLVKSHIEYPIVPMWGMWGNPLTGALVPSRRFDSEGLMQFCLQFQTSEKQETSLYNPRTMPGVEKKGL